MSDDYEADAPEAMTGEDARKIAKEWADRIRGSEKREDRWLKDAEAAEKVYLADESSDRSGDLLDFNILHSNVETIVPAIYNSTPAPEIKPRHNAKDDLGKAVSDALERAIAAQIDDNRLDTEVEDSAQDVFVAGRGVVRVRFDAEQVMQADPMTGEAIMALANERVVFENVSWRDFRMGAAKRWRDVPWVAFRHSLTREEIERIGDDELLSAQNDDAESAEEDAFVLDVWEIWCRESGRVYFVTDDGSKLIQAQEDPLGLSGFFPMAAPVQPIKATGQMTPVCPFKIYRTLAEEMDEITRRIRRITEGLKVVGFVAGNADNIEGIVDAEDNTLIPVKDWESAAATGGVEKAIAWWPVQHAITVLRELYVARDQAKQSIYEITGISDIVRGQSAASETATAQNIKTQWGSLRVKKMQRLLERQVRDLFVIAAEIVCQHFSAPTLQRLAGMQLPPEAQRLIGAPLDHYRIDVESDSTIRADATQQRQEMAEFLQGSAQFFQTMAPIVQGAPQSAAPMIEIYASFARRFNLGREAEMAVEALAENARKLAENPPPNPEQERMKAEMQMQVQEMQHRQHMEMQRLGLDVKKAGLDVELKKADLALKNRELGLQEGRLQLDEAKGRMDAAATAAEIDMEEEQQRAVKLEGAN